jgi:pimeloyl-ACP methyl ester carboxylesterase
VRQTHTRLAGVALLLGLLLLAGCAQPRFSRGPELAAGAGWRWQYLAAGQFDLASAVRPGQAALATVYLEGDGFAFVTPGQPSMDPTPQDPVALRLALAHPAGGGVAWLARPCQYSQEDRGRGCSQPLWTTRRWAPEVLTASNAALDRLKAQLGAQRLVLVGYSGGGALAALLAARRDDVVGLITVAANLDLAAWVARDRLAPLVGSLDPALEAAPRLGRLRQWHFSGAEDRVTGADLARAFARRLPAGTPVRLETVPGFDHECCWVRDWRRLAAPALASMVAE